MQHDYTFIVSNKCQCNICKDIIESKTTHDFKQCSCKAIFTDGGTEYIRRGFKNEGDILDLTETRPATRKELLSEIKRYRSVSKTSISNFYSNKIKEMQALLLKQRYPNLV